MSCRSGSSLELFQKVWLRCLPNVLSSAKCSFLTPYTKLLALAAQRCWFCFPLIPSFHLSRAPRPPRRWTPAQRWTPLFRCISPMSLMLGIASDVGLHSSTHSMHLANEFDDRLSHPFHLPVSPFFGICYRLLHPFRCLNTLPVPISRKDCPFKVRFVFAYGVDNSDKPSYLLWPNR